MLIKVDISKFGAKRFRCVLPVVEGNYSSNHRREAQQSGSGVETPICLPETRGKPETVETRKTISVIHDHIEHGEYQLYTIRSENLDISDLVMGEINPILRLTPGPAISGYPMEVRSDSNCWPQDDRDA